MSSMCADIATQSMHRSGHVPTSEEANLLKTCIAHLDEEISASPPSTSALADQLALHKALLSPIRRLCPELLSYIFVLAAPEDWYEKKSGTIAHLCTQVCFSWREITTGTPALWSTINVFVGIPDEERLFNFDSDDDDEDDGGIPLSEILGEDIMDTDPYISFEEEDAGDSDDDNEECTADEEKWALITRTYLERSAQRPLSITYGAGREYVKRSASSERTWRLLAQEKARWMSVNLTVPVEVFRAQAQCTPVPLLESLHLSLYSETYGYYSPLDFFWDAPLLRQIVIDPHAVPTGEETELPPWCPTNLCVFGHTPRPYNVVDASRLIRQYASTLQDGGIWVSQNAGDEDVPPALMTDFPALRSLIVLDVAFEFLGLIRSAPKLQSIFLRETMNADSDVGLSQLQAFSAMLARASWPSLTSLTLLDIQAPFDAALECLRAASMLSELIMRDEDLMRYLSEEEERRRLIAMNADFLRALTRSPTKQNMIYSRAHALHGHDSLQTLTEFTSSVTPLDRLTMDYVREFGNDIRKLVASREVADGQVE
ncbi:hypothetical protein K525DRAFT_360159 [Schizophyllum commune Loenen D]|nr:hypothetical protein K525DRAFT_360159 [Schizophyllum commune Loenen D]